MEEEEQQLPDGFKYKAGPGRPRRPDRKPRYSINPRTAQPKKPKIAVVITPETKEKADALKKAMDVLNDVYYGDPAFRKMRGEHTKAQKAEKVVRERESRTPDLLYSPEYILGDILRLKLEACRAFSKLLHLTGNMHDKLVIGRMFFDGANKTAEIATKLVLFERMNNKADASGESQEWLTDIVQGLKEVK